MTHHIHEIVQAPAWHFCRSCGRIWDDEFPEIEYIAGGDLASEIAAYAPSQAPVPEVCLSDEGENA